MEATTTSKLTGLNVTARSSVTYETASKKALTAQLKELEAAGIISWNVIPTVPVQVEYAVTAHGRTLFPILDVMCS